LPHYYFEEGANDEWTGCSEGILEFTKVIQNKLLEKLLHQLEDMIDE
jgi:hypothetical protein